MSELRQNQWDESKHPRDEEGKFTDGAGDGKMSYEDFRDQRQKLAWKLRQDLTTPKKKAFERLLPLADNPDDLLTLDKEVFQENIVTKEQLNAAIEKNKEKQAQKEAEERKKKEAARAEREAEERRIAEERAQHVERVRQNTTATEAQAEKLLGVSERAEKAYEQAVGGRRGSTGAGYVGKSKSVRANEAEIEGRFPATKAAQILGVTRKKLDEVIGTSGEWHHTGALYKETNYYDIADVCDIVSDLPYESPEYIRKTYSAASIENVEKLYGIKLN